MKKHSVIVLTICALFLFFKYIAQLYPSLIGTELMQNYGYDGVMLAIMASSYYYSYTFMQIVAGFIIDSVPLKIPMFFAILIIALMMICFAHTHHFYVMCLSRAFMGVGASFATVIYMKCAATYTSTKTFGLISSFLATATMLGAAFGGTPVALLFHQMGWRAGLNLVAIVGIIMAVSVLIFQKSKEKTIDTPRLAKLEIIQSVISKKNNWLLLFYSGLTFSPVAVLGGLWGTPFLMTKFSISTSQASFLLSMMFVGHAVGSPLWAVLSAKLNQKKSLMHLANLFAFIVILTIIYGNFSYQFSIALFFIFGFSVGCFMLSFELCRQMNHVAIMGLAVAFINSGEGIVGSVMEPFIGHVLDVSKAGKLFSLENYQLALSILPCCFILSSLVLIFIQRRNEAVIKTQLQVAEVAG